MKLIPIYITSALIILTQCCDSQPAFSQNGEEQISRHDRGLLRLDLLDNKWVQLRANSYFIDSEPIMYGSIFKYFVHQGSTVIDSSAELFQLWGNRYRSEPDSYSDQFLDAVKGEVLDDEIYLLANTSQILSMGGGLLSPGPRNREFLVWNTKSRKITNIPSVSPTWSLYAYSTRDLERMVDYGFPHADISQPRNGNMLFYSRNQKEWRAHPTDIPRYEISISVCSTTSKKLGRSIVLDSLQASESDLSDQVHWVDGNEFIVIRRVLPTDTLVFTRYDSTGRQLSPPQFFLDGVKTTFGVSLAWASYLRPVSIDTIQTLQKADYSMKQLNDGRYVVAWTKILADSSTDIFCGLFGQNMKWIGFPKRLHSDPTGNQYSPGLSVLNDSVVVTWLDTRSGKEEAYLRRFQVDQILGAQFSVSSVVSALHPNNPNPFTSHTTIHYESPGGHVRIHVFDLLGRLITTLIDGYVVAGSNSIEFLTHNLMTGTYIVRMDTERNTFARLISLIR